MLWPIAFMMISAVTALLMWLAFGGDIPLRPSAYQVKVPLSDADNLYPGSDVQISGVSVGRVSSIAAVDHRPVATIDLHARFAPLRVGARAVPREKSLLGEGYLEIAPGSPSAPIIPDGGRINPNRVESHQQLSEVLQTFDEPTRKSARRLLRGLAAAFSGRGAQLNDSLGEAAPLATNLEAVARELDQQRPQLARLTFNGGQVLAALGERQGPLRDAVIAGRKVLAVTARRRTELRATIHELPAFLSHLRRAARVLDAASPDLNSAVSSLMPVATRIGPAITEVDRAAPEFRRLFRALPSTLAAGDRGLPAAKRIVDEVGPSFAQVYPAMRELIPFLQLLAVSKDSLLTLFANSGQVTNATLIGSNGKLTNVGSGVPSLWNETLAGWTKKLPTNRPNPYPKPKGALDIAGAGLKAYDCRQLNNVEYLPATGGKGATDCRLQGPWTFNGVSQYFPHLTLAPPARKPGRRRR